MKTISKNAVKNLLSQEGNIIPPIVGETIQVSESLVFAEPYALTRVGQDTFILEPYNQDVKKVEFINV